MLNNNYRIKKFFLSLSIIGCFLLLCCLLFLQITIKEIEVSGNKQYTSEEIITMLFDGKWDYNTVYLYYRDKTKEHESIPFIQDYQILFQGLDKIEVIIYEKNIVGCLQYMSNYMYFDKDGVIVESSKERIPGIPLISGLDFGKIILYEPLAVGQEGIFEKILNLTQVLDVNEIQVDKITYDNQMNAALFIGGLKVVLGSDEFLHDKVSELHNMLVDEKRPLEGKSGVLNLENYNENGNNGFYFKEG